MISKIMGVLEKNSNMTQQYKEPGSFEIYPGSFQGKDVIIKQVKLQPRSDEAVIFVDNERYNSVVSFLQETNPNIEKLLHTEKIGCFRTFTFEWSEGSVDQLFLPDDDERKYHIDPRYMRPSVTILLELAKGLAFIHSKGEFHGDIKPQNVLLFLNNKDSQIDFKWANFGLSNAFLFSNDKDQFGLSGITKAFAWQPVEIIQQISQILQDEGLVFETSYISYMQKLFYPRIGSIEADIFSAGCFFFYFLTKGFHPFGQSTNIPSNIQDGHMESLHKLPRMHYARDVLIKMMDISSKHRKDALDEIIQVFEIKHKRALYDVCSLYHPSQEDCFVLGRLIEDKDPLVKITEPNEQGYTPLILLVRNNLNESLLQELKIFFASLKKASYSVNSADIINTPDVHDYLPVMYLFLNYRHSNLFEILTLLKENGLHFSQVKQKSHHQNLEFLAHAYEHLNLLDILKLLFSCGLTIDDAINEEKIKTIRERHQEDHRSIIGYFCKFWKNIAESKDTEEIVRLLINNGAKPEHHHNCLKGVECCINKIPL